MKPTITLYALFILFGLSAYAAEPTNLKKRKGPEPQPMELVPTAKPSLFYSMRQQQLEEQEGKLLAVFEEAIHEKILPRELPIACIKTIIFSYLKGCFVLHQRIPYLRGDKDGGEGESILCHVRLPSDSSCEISSALQGTTTYDILSGDLIQHSKHYSLLRTRTNIKTLTDQAVPYLSFKTMSRDANLVGLVNPADCSPLRVCPRENLHENILKIEPSTTEKLEAILKAKNETRDIPQVIPHISAIAFSKSGNRVAVYVRDLLGLGGDLEIYGYGLDILFKE